MTNADQLASFQPNLQRQAVRTRARLSPREIPSLPFEFIWVAPKSIEWLIESGLIDAEQLAILILDNNALEAFYRIRSNAVYACLSTSAINARLTRWLSDVIAEDFSA